MAAGMAIFLFGGCHVQFFLIGPQLHLTIRFRQGVIAKIY